MPETRPLPRGFLDLQLTFVDRAAAVSGQPFDSLLIDHTCIVGMCDLRVSRENPGDPDWRTFVKGLLATNDPTGFAHDFYLARRALRSPPADDGHFGCFSYDYPFREKPAARLHFRNVDPSPAGALTDERRSIRHSELKTLFQDLRTRHPDAKTIRGGSWLHNIEPYRRLFPPAYVSTARPVGYEHQFMALWGQFLCGNQGIHQPTVDRFNGTLAQATSLEECECAFPHEVLRPECAVEIFFEHFGIQ